MMVFLKRAAISFCALACLFVLALAINRFTDWVYDSSFFEGATTFLLVEITHISGSGSTAEVAVITIYLLCKAIIIAILYSIVKRFVFNDLELFGIEIDSQE